MSGIRVVVTMLASVGILMMFAGVWCLWMAWRMGNEEN